MQVVVLVTAYVLYSHVEERVAVEASWVQHMETVCQRTITPETPKLKGLTGTFALLSPLAIGMGIVVRARLYEEQQISSIATISRERQVMGHAVGLLVSGVPAVVVSVVVPHGLHWLSSLVFNWSVPFFLLVMSPWVLTTLGVVPSIDLSDLEHRHPYISL